MTIPANLTALLGGVDLNDIIANVRNVKTLGRTALTSLRNSVTTNPDVAALRAELEKILNPFLQISEEELKRLDGHRHAINSRVSRDYQHEPGPVEPPPPPPPPAAGFPYMIVLTDNPSDVVLLSGDLVYRSEADHGKFVVNDGKVGSPRPTTFWPELAGIDEPDWRIVREVKK